MNYPPSFFKTVYGYNPITREEHVFINIKEFAAWRREYGFVSPNDKVNKEADRIIKSWQLLKSGISDYEKHINTNH